MSSPDDPNGLFLEQLAYNGLITAWPRHYLEQFHEKYNPDVEQLAERRAPPTGSSCSPPRQG